MHNWYKHGMYGTPEHKAWAAMLQRCSNPNDNRYHSHGGRGIKVCDRWLNSFENFYEDRVKLIKSLEVNLFNISCFS